jgi:hypothetical protein
MSSQQLLFPDHVHAKLEKLYANRQHTWFNGEGEWPLTITLGCPNEKQAIDQQQVILSWVTAWRSFCGPFEVIWRERQWRRIGVQSLPEKIILRNSNELADAIGEGIRWRRAAERYTTLWQLWPNVGIEARVLFQALADFEDRDFEILQTVVKWFLENPASGLYPRQLPIAGAHTKWLEGRLQLVCALLACADGRDSYQSTFSFLGLREPSVPWRMRVLDSALRAQFDGLGDFSAPIEDLQRLSISPQNVFIVENLQTFLAFEDLKDAIVLLGMGFRVKEIGTIQWLQSARCYYWGDLDTAGFAILDLARSVIPHLESVLMDEQTLLMHQNLWVEERKQHTVSTLNHLTADEAQVYEGLKSQRWGTDVRLEQERLPWDACWRALNYANSNNLMV